MSTAKVITTKEKNTIVPDILRARCTKITNIDKSIKELAKTLVDTVMLPENKAAGLSAPQIGIAKRICVVRKFKIDSEKNELSNEYVLINPKITSFSKPTDVRWEACLSIPNLFGKVERSKRVSIIYQDLQGNSNKLKASGFFARVIQHELDHLDGILYTDKVIGTTLTEKELDAHYKAKEPNQI